MIPLGVKVTMSPSSFDHVEADFEGDVGLFLSPRSPRFIFNTPILPHRPNCLPLSPPKCCSLADRGHAYLGLRGLTVL